MQYLSQRQKQPARQPGSLRIMPDLSLRAPMVDTPLASLVINIKVLQVVVEIDRSGTQVSSEQRRVGGEDGGHVDMTFPAQGDGETGLPLVEMGDDGRGPVVRSELAQEPGDQVPEDDRLVGLVVVGRGGDPGQVPQVGLPLVQSVIGRARVKEDDLGCALDQPSTVDELDTSIPHGLKREGKRGTRRTGSVSHMQTVSTCSLS